MDQEEDTTTTGPTTTRVRVARAPVANAESFGTGATAPTAEEDEDDDVDNVDVESSGSVSSDIVAGDTNNSANLIIDSAAMVDKDKSNNNNTSNTGSDPNQAEREPLQKEETGSNNRPSSTTASEAKKTSLTEKLDAGSFGTIKPNNTKNLSELPPPQGAPGSGPVDLDETVVTTASMMDLSILATTRTTPTTYPSLLGGGADGDSQQQPLEDSLMYSPDGKTTLQAEEEAKQQKEEWVNHGLQKWEATRKAWLHRPSHQNSTQNGEGSNNELEAPPPPQPRAVPLDVDAIIDILFLSTTTSQQQQQRNAASANAKPSFPHNVALPQMVDILQDLWEAEGLDA